MIRIWVGHVLNVLRAMPSESAHCCATSPPYWGARDYQLKPVVWEHSDTVAYRREAGDWSVLCDHEWGEEIILSQRGKVGDHSTLEGSLQAGGEGRLREVKQGRFCRHCGAWLGTLGLEPTIDLFVAHIVDVFREVRRVLRKDGVLWLNFGDCYATTPRGNKPGDYSTSSLTNPRRQDQMKRGDVKDYGQLKKKDLCGIPWQIAFALRADGWWLRSALPWIKANPMPESVRDRATTAHEYVFLLSKSEHYYYDGDAVRRPQSGNAHSRGTGITPKSVSDTRLIKANHSFHSATSGSTVVPGGRNWRTGDLFRDSLDWAIEQAREYLQHLESVKEKGGMLLSGEGDPLALLVNPQGFSGSHFAVFPPALVEPLIKASTSERGCCPGCGAPWERITQASEEYAQHLGKDWANYEQDDMEGRGHFMLPGGGKASQRPIKRKAPALTAEYLTVGWRPTCSCYDERYRQEFPRARSRRKRRQQDLSDRWFPRVRRRPGNDTWPVAPCVVLDPFGGVGTTAMVADREGSDATLIELNRKYAYMARDRLVQDAGPMFAKVELIELGS
jgi:DNA modification methylase